MIVPALALLWSGAVFALPTPAAKSVMQHAAVSAARAVPAPAPAPVPAPVPAPAPAGVAPVAAAPTPPAAAPVDAIVLPATLTADRQALLRMQVMLDRAGFSPGVIDGKNGSNFQSAFAAWKAAHNDAAPVADTAPLPLMRYAIAPEDVAGPFAPVPKDLAEMAKMKIVGYTTPLEGLAERFHADEAFLKELNPHADFAAAGTVLLVPDIAPAKLPAKVAKIEIDKTHQQLRAYAAEGKLLAVYPATVGSTERPAPSGRYRVVTWAPHATYTYDPKRLTFGKRVEGKLVIPAGPNNPVGGMWIALNKPTYGIHGTPDPQLVGKRASHGCVRLTNWDAATLGAAVQQGTQVVFVGVEQRKG